MRYDLRDAIHANVALFFYSALATIDSSHYSLFAFLSLSLSEHMHGNYYACQTMLLTSPAHPKPFYQVISARNFVIVILLVPFLLLFAACCSTVCHFPVRKYLYSSRILHPLPDRISENRNLLKKDVQLISLTYKKICPMCSRDLLGFCTIWVTGCLQVQTWESIKRKQNMSKCDIDTLLESHVKREYKAKESEVRKLSLREKRSPNQMKDELRLMHYRKGGVGKLFA